MIEPLPQADEPRSGKPAPDEGPIPVAKKAEGHVIQPDEGPLPPTGRTEPEGTEGGLILGGGA
jgi:hypothetical protein